MNENEIDISDLDKAEVFAALYNNAKAQGMGFMRYTPKDMTKDEAQEMLDSNERLYFDYVNGRVMKVNLSKVSFNPCLYDRDNGEGAANHIINKLREEK